MYVTGNAFYDDEKMRHKLCGTRGEEELCGSD